MVETLPELRPLVRPHRPPRRARPGRKPRRPCGRRFCTYNAIARVASQDAGATALAATVTANYPATPTSGHLLIAVVYAAAASAAAGFSMGGSGWLLATTSPDYPTAGPTQGLALFYKVAGAGETTAVQANCTGATNMHLQIYEYAGTATTSPLDKTGSPGGASVSTTSSLATGTTPTTSQADELVFVALGHSGAITSLSWTNSITALQTTPRLDSGERIVSATGTYSSTASWVTGRTAGALIATFKAGGTPRSFGTGPLGIGPSTSGEKTFGSVL